MKKYKQYKRGETYRLNDELELQFKSKDITFVSFNNSKENILVIGDFSLLNSFKPESIAMILSVYIIDGLNKATVRDVAMLVESFESFKIKQKGFSSKKSAYYRKVGKAFMDEVFNHG